MAMELHRIHDTVTVPPGAFLFIENEFQTVMPVSSRRTDIKVEDILRGNEMEVINALADHNVIWMKHEGQHRLVKVNKEQKDFDIDDFFVLFTMGNPKNYDVPAVILIDAPYFIVYANGDTRVHKGRLGNSSLDLVEIDEEPFVSRSIVPVTRHKSSVPSRNTAVQSAPEFERNGDSPAGLSKSGRDVHFFVNTTMKTVDGVEITFAAGAKRPIYVLMPESLGQIRISGETFNVEELARVIGVELEGVL